MSWWNLGGLNPSFKEFIDKYPKKTLIGVLWALYWRMFVLVMGIQIMIVLILIMVT